MDPQNLSGLWHGQYNYPAQPSAVPFVATLLETGGALSGSITEKSTLPPTVGEALYATVRGERDGAAVRFTKMYESDDERFQVVSYDGQVNGDGSEIEGVWRTGGWQGKFLMIRGLSNSTSADAGILESIR